jgi:hypothetical protein
MSCDVWNRELDVPVDGCEVEIEWKLSCKTRDVRANIYAFRTAKQRAREQQSDITSSDESCKAQLDF